MAKKRKFLKNRKNLFNSFSLPKLPSLDLDPDIKRGIFIVFLLAIGAIGFLSLFNLAGPLGVNYLRFLSYMFGWGKFLIPLVFLILGFALYNREAYELKGANYLGLFIFILSFYALLELFIPVAQWSASLDLGNGGGYIGYIMALGFIRITGFWVTLIIILSLILISLMLLFNTTLSALVGGDSPFAKFFQFFKYIFSLIFRRRESDEDEDDEEEEEDHGEEEEDGEEKEGEENEEEEPAEDEDEIEEKAKFSKRKIKEKTEKIIPEMADSIWTPTNIKIDLPMELLSSKKGKPMSGDINNNKVIIERSLKNFGIEVEMADISVGPTVTQYTFKPADGVKLSRITTLNNDLALALAAHPIRIEAPIPGKSLVGVEVPNHTKAIVGLREILNSKEFKERKNNQTIALGKDVSGKAWTYDITRMPHLLVAGATNSGKSVCLSSIIVSLLYQNNPDELRFIMVDPKRVELTAFNGIPHLLTPVITDFEKTINAMRWCLNEMDRRFDVLNKSGKKNIQTYNTASKDKLPYIVFIIDELADLMMVASKDVEGAVMRLAQLARAVGIHLILATQRPSVNIITGVIKANMPARIAFSVASGVDSRTILDSLGAEKLLGSGDMLFVTQELSKPKRIQGAFVSETEVKKIVRHIKEQSDGPNYIEGVTDRQKVKGLAGVGMSNGGGGNGGEDDLFEEAKEQVINMGRASTSLLQRRLKVGYGRAAKLVDMLEEAGIVGPANGSKPREVLVSREQYENLINTGVSGMSLHSREEAQAPSEYLPGDEEEEEDEDEENEEEEKDENEDDDIDEEGEKDNEEEKSDEEESDDDDEADEEVEEPETGKKKITAEPKKLKKIDDEDGWKLFSK